MNALPSEYLPPLKILILDDNSFDRARLRRAINVAQIRCQIEESGSLADLIYALKCGEFNVVTLDFDLPDGTGIEALRRVKFTSSNAQLISIMVTGNEAPHVAKLAVENGCSSFLLKSALTPDALNQAIVDGHRSRTSRFAPVHDLVASSPRFALTAADKATVGCESL